MQIKTITDIPFRTYRVDILKGKGKKSIIKNVEKKELCAQQVIM